MRRNERIAAILVMVVSALFAASRGVAQDPARSPVQGSKGVVCQAMGTVLRDGHHWASKDGSRIQRPKISLAVYDPTSQPDCDWAEFGVDVSYSFGPDKGTPTREPGLGYIGCPTFRSKSGCAREQLLQAAGISFSKPQVSADGGLVSFETTSQCGWDLCGTAFAWTVTRKADGSWSPEGQVIWEQ